MRLTGLAAFLVVLIDVSCCAGADPTEQINSQLRARWNRDGVQAVPACSDQTFVRRVYLDLAGRIPTVKESEAFIASERPQKRKELIDSLLKSEDHAQHFADLFDTILMGRTEEKKYSERAKHGWRSYLEAVFRDNRSWDEVAREILIARPTEKERRGAVWFLYERNNQHQAIAEAVAPAFFGVRIECAQCHDHMMADEIKQAHYWGLVAFFNRSENKQTSNGPRLAESAIGGFSDFADIYGDSSPNRLTFLHARTVQETRPGKDEKPEDSDALYVSAEVNGDPREPKFSRRKKFVTQILDGHPLLARAMVNRIWAILMGRGMVHPHDEIDSMHPPSHPELFDWLSDDFAASGFDVRRLIRSIVRSDAYGLSSVRPDLQTPPETFAWYLERPLTAEQLARSIQMVVRGQFRNDAPVVSDLRQQLLEVLPEEIEVTIGDALFFANNDKLDQFLDESRGEGHLMTRVLQLESNSQRAQRMVQAAFGRPPSLEESDQISAYLDARTDRLEVALQQVVWSLLTSAEFRFNH